MSDANGGFVSLPSNLIVSFGQKGCGKTTDILRAFPTAVYFGPERSLRNIAASQLGIAESCGIVWPIVGDRPRVFPRVTTGAWAVGTLEDLTARLNALARPAKGKTTPLVVDLDAPAVVIDEFGTYTRATLVALDASHTRPAKGGVEVLDVRAKYLTFSRIFEDFIAAVGRVADVVPVVISGHEQEPSTNDDGKYLKGGIKLGAKTRMDRFDQECDIGARIRRDPDSLDPWHPYCYEVGYNNSKYWTRNRFGWTDMVPANLRAILSESTQRIRLPRVPGLEWQDDVAEETAEECKGVTTVDDVRAVLARLEGRHMEGRHPLHVQWAWQDGIAMVALRRQAGENILARGTTAAVAVKSRPGRLK